MRVSRCACRGDGVEEPEQVVDVRHEVGEDDVVEGLAEIGILGRAELEAKSGMPRAVPSQPSPG